jgi:hypothetical protein
MSQRAAGDSRAAAPRRVGRRREIAGALVAACLTIAFAGPAASAGAAPTGPGAATTLTRYVALGDSYSSGEGNPPFIGGTDGKCDRSSAAYGPLLVTSMNVPATDFSFPACSGAMVADLVANLGADATGQFGEGPQLDAIAPPGKSSSTTGLVTLSIGGNDAGFAFAVTDCARLYTATYVPVPNPDATYDTCQEAIDHYSALGKRVLTDGGRILVTKMDNSFELCDAKCAREHAESKDKAVVTVPSLFELYVKIHRRAPNARIRVLLYPQLFTTRPTGSCLAGSFTLLGAPIGVWYLSNAYYTSLENEIGQLNTAADVLDKLIAGQVAKARKAGIDIQTVDSRPSYAAAPGHGLCAGTPWINPLTFRASHSIEPVPVRGSFHPTAAGQQDFASLFAASLG